jgi:hypothetical protein
MVDFRRWLACVCCPVDIRGAKRARSKHEPRPIAAPFECLDKQLGLLV